MTSAPTPAPPRSSTASPGSSGAPRHSDTADARAPAAASTPRPDAATASHPPPTGSARHYPAATPTRPPPSATDPHPSTRRPTPRMSTRARAGAPRQATARAARSPAPERTTPRHTTRTTHPATGSTTGKAPAGTRPAAPDTPSPARRTGRCLTHSTPNGRCLDLSGCRRHEDHDNGRPCHAETPLQHQKQGSRQPPTLKIKLRCRGAAGPRP
jgi:hypothetical protein